VKRVLIAGAGSYIGTRLAAWLDPARYLCDTLDMRGDEWRNHDLSAYDSVVMVAGIAHRRETGDNRALFDRVNRRLAAEAGQQAKAEGVRQFVFFSSMSVYGVEVGRIHADTPENPTTAYGKSKLDGEKALTALADSAFHVAVLRPPMIYGPGCRGNYPRLSRLIRKLRVFPRVKNERSMLYIDTLCKFMDALLESGEGGLYFPQNGAYVSTDDLALAVAKAHGTVLFRPRGLGWLLRLLGRNGGTVGKVFGSLTYDQSMSGKFMPRQQTEFFRSILETEAVE
jgi:nucleoside-diphosphate-sugar epimerase